MFDPKAQANAGLLAAAEAGNVQAISQALAAGADARFVEPQQQNTPLHQAAKVGNAQAIELLLRAGGDVNATNSVNATPLIYAAQKGHLDAVKILLSGGARKDILTRKGKSALALAEEKNFGPVVELLRVPQGGAGGVAGGCFGGGGGAFGAPGGFVITPPVSSSAGVSSLFGAPSAIGGAPAFGAPSGGFGSTAMPAAGGAFGAPGLGLGGGSSVFGAPPAGSAEGTGGVGAGAGAAGAPALFGGQGGCFGCSPAVATTASKLGAPDTISSGGLGGGLGGGIGASGVASATAGFSGFGAAAPGGGFGTATQPAFGSLPALSSGLSGGASPQPVAPAFAAGFGKGGLGLGSGGGGGGGGSAARLQPPPSVQLPSPPEESVSCLSFRSGAVPSSGAAEPELLAASAWDGTVRVWDVSGVAASMAAAGASAADGARPRLAHIFAAGVPALCVAWSTDGTSVLRGGCDGSITRLDLSSAGAGGRGAEVVVGTHGGGVCALRTDSQMAGTVLSASWDGTLRSWDLRAGSARAALTTAKLASRVLCADARWPHAVVGLALCGSVLLFDLRRPSEPLRTEAVAEKLKQPPRCVAIAPPGATRAGGDSDGSYSFCVATYEGRVSVQRTGSDAAQPAERYVFKAHCSADRAFAVNSLSFCAQDKTLLTAGSDGGLSVWDLNARSKLLQMPNAGQQVSCATFDGAGRGFAYAASYDWTHGEKGADPTKRPEVWLVSRPAAAWAP